MLDSLVYRNRSTWSRSGMIRSMVFIMLIIVSSMFNNDKLLAAASKGSSSGSVGPKTVYLTFDDGPSGLTPKVLDILKKEHIQATFFVLGEQVKQYPEMINRMSEEGHVIGNHSFNHNYKELYQAFPIFWNQIKETEEEIREITGVRPQLVRAPGGTAGHFDHTYFDLLKQGGYIVTDWNVDSGDSKRRGVPASDILRDATSNMKSNSIVLLMHDGSGHSETVKALPDIIAKYRAHGYQFASLSTDIAPVQFKVTAKAESLHRSAPDASWVRSHIPMNTALFEQGLPLMLEVGPIETTLKQGEYLIADGRYMVPLRTVVERLGGNIRWDQKARSATFSFDETTTLKLDVDQGVLVSTKRSGELTKVTVPVQIINDSVWVPLRDMFEKAGHVHMLATVDLTERRVKIA